MKLKGFASALALGALTVGARAEGIRIYQMSAEAQMRADAVVASASDAAVAWYNPAMLTGLGRGDLSVNLDNLLLYAQFTDANGVTEKSQQTYFPIPALYYGQRLGISKWAWGIAVNTPFGLTTEYSKTSSFRYLTTGGDVKLVSVNPSVAYAVSEKLSLAMGGVYYYSTAELSQQYPWASVLGAPGTPDGQVKVKGKGDGFGGNLALHAKVSDKDSIGLTYRSQVVVGYSGDKAEFTDIPTAAGIGTSQSFDAETTIRFPDMVGAGWARKFDTGVVELGGAWTNWTDVDTLDVRLSGREPLGPAGAFFPDTQNAFYWKNAWSLHAGGERYLNDAWSISGGYFFAKSPTRESTYSPVVPDGDHHVFSSGLTHRRGGLTLRVPLVLIVQTGTDSVDSGFAGADGKYELTGIEIGIGASYRFGG